MESVRQSCRPKHQILILRCYPKYQKGVQEVKPNSSELSYLLYYVSTRRSKLTKVGAFLEKRAARDVWRRRLGNVQVTLQVLSALIEKVPRDLPIYARSVLTVIETVLRSNEISMVEDSIPTFKTFCRHQDMIALTAEQDFANQYLDVLRLYADFADPNPSAQARIALSPQIAIRWRNAGLRAIRGVVGPEGLFDEGVDLLRIVLPVILKNLYAGEEGMLVSLELQLQESEKKDLDRASQDGTAATPDPTSDTTAGDAAVASRSTADADKKAEIETRLLALRCLERIIVSGSSRGQVRTATTVVLQFITTKDLLGDDRHNEDPNLNSKGNWATSLIELVAKWCPVQIRFVILVTTMENLLDTDPTNLQRSLTLVRMVDWLLKSSANMIGLSVMDVLFGLLRTISRVLRLESKKPIDESKGTLNGAELPEKAQTPGSGPDETAGSRLIVLLEQCIGSLATHIYYADQVADMIRAILMRVKPPGNAENSAEPTPDQSPVTLGATISQSETRLSFGAGKVAALRAVKNILLVGNMRRFVAAAGIESRKRVGIHVWEGTQWLLHDPEQDVRYAYADAFLSWLKLETNKGDFGVQGDAERQPRGFLEPVENKKKPGKRVPPSSSSKSEMVRSNFLRLLHLAVYEVALEFPTKRSEFLLLHLLLTSLVERLGVNAIVFGLPMILRLQDDMAAVTGFDAKVNIGSLVYGYLLAVCENFGLMGAKVGHEIADEVEKRKRQCAWFQEIRLPPVPLDKILLHAGTEVQVSSGSGSTSILFPFQSVKELVQQIEQACSWSMMSSAQTPTGSPTRRPSVSVSSKSQKNFELPASFREQMLSSWSKEACLEAIESENATSVSTHGSKHGTTTIRDHHQANGALEDSPNSTNSQVSSQYSTPGVHVSGTGLDVQGSQDPDSPNNNSNRDLPVRVNELRRVLTVSKENHPRRLSPLRGRLDSSTKGDDSSSAESMVSGGAFSVSDGGGDQTSIRSQSLKDGVETPRPLSPKPSTREDGQLDQQPQPRFNNVDSDGIPPVPPIPPSLSNVSGNQPNEYRPFTAPNMQRRPSKSSGRANSNSNNNNDNNKPGTATSTRPRKSKSLTRHRSQSRTGLANSPFATEYYSPANGYKGYGASQSALEGSLDPSERDDIRKLVDGYLSAPRYNATGTGNYNSASYLQLARMGSRGANQDEGGRPRRKSTGIGKPPY